MNPKPVNIFCHGCATVATVNKVTAGLRCTCGSHDLDVFTGTRAQMARIAALSTPTFAEFMTATAATHPVAEAWNVYSGPMPGPNPMTNGVGPVRCPNCNGGKFDIQEGNVCRACRGSGIITPTTSVTPPPAVAPHKYPSNQTKIPFMGRRKQAGRPSGDPLGSPEEHIKATTPGYTERGMRQPSEPFSWDNTETHYPKADTRSPAVNGWQPHDAMPDGPFVMHGTSCPGCGQGPLTLEKDHKEDAWATCPSCGPLANVDRNPEIDPYDFGEGFTPDLGRRAASRAARTTKGRLLRMVAAVVSTNPGLTPREVVGLVRMSLRKYPEGT